MQTGSFRNYTRSLYPLSVTSRQSGVSETGNDFILSKITNNGKFGNNSRPFRAEVP